jgi:hypothetical protein
LNIEQFLRRRIISVGRKAPRLEIVADELARLARAKCDGFGFAEAATRRRIE